MKSLAGLAEVIAGLSGFVLAATQNWTGALVCGAIAVLVGMVFLAASAPRLSRWLTVAATIPILVGGGLIGAAVGHRVTAATATSAASDQDDPDQDTRTTTTTTMTTTSTSRTTAPPTTTTTTTTTPDVPDGAYWVGPLRLGAVGMDVDGPPPDPSAGDGMDIFQAGHVIKVNSGQGLQIVVDTAATPTKQSCQDALSGVADQIAVEIPMPTVPGRYCFVTTEDRIATLELTQRTESGFEGRLILWT